jgi:hypothetical protein
MVMDTLNNYSKKERKQVFSYIQEYCKKVTFKNDSFEIRSEEDLKQILFGIDQRYYTTILNKEKRLANSIIKIEA